MTSNTAANLFDENVVCPLTGKPLLRDGNRLVAGEDGPEYEVFGCIALLAVDRDNAAESELPSTSSAVEDFYTESPFPNYNEFDSIDVFVRRANEGVYARMLRQQIPLNANVLEVGCGTGQLSNFLAATTMSRIYATDMTFASLALGVKFAQQNDIKGIKFLNMNLFSPCIKKASMDIVISNGVLHHTADPKKAFLSIAELVKPGGYAIIGLYNKIGRLRTDFRRILTRAFGERVLFLDPHLRKNLSADKRRAWIQDQYFHPRESKHSMTEVLEWFDEAGFSYVSSIPKIRGTFTSEERLFEPKTPGSALDRTLAEVEMLFSRYGGEGGLFIMIGRKAD